jgi:AraC-like DNA-binding protein
MSVSVVERPSDSPYVETITHGTVTGAGSTIRPAEVGWHMVIVRHDGQTNFLLTGPWSTASPLQFGGEAELIWIRFAIGTFMPHLPNVKLSDSEIMLPDARSDAFWLNSSAWEFPTPDNVDVFIDRLIRQELIVREPAVESTLQGQPAYLSLRALQNRFLHVTGLTHKTIQQIQRAQQAQLLLEQGLPILDTVEQAGYFDQPHLTRSLKRYVGYTPAQILRLQHQE